MISQCPNCKTRFTISEEKLNVAGGNVRCGACMKVFSASDYQIQTPAAITNNNPADNATTASTSNHEVTREWLSDLLPESEEDAHKEHAINSMVGFEPPPTIEAPPIEITKSDKPSLKNRLLSVIGAGLCLALLLALGLHWLLAHPDQFKDHPRWGAAYRLACHVRACQQTLSANDYQTQSLRIISHPEQPSTLRLEAVIINRTQRQLPFPTIEVQFNNIEKQPLTRYSLNAAEYLNGELQGAEYFAPATPVRVSVDIPDPGATAVNYSIKLK